MALNPKISINSLVMNRRKFSPSDWRAILMRVGKGIGEKNLSMMAAGIAFFSMLALFPAIAATISIYGYMSDPIVVRENLLVFESIMPDQVYQLLDSRVTQLITGRRTTLGIASIVSVLLATWSARAGITAMIAGLNVICREDNTRNFVMNLLVAYCLTLLLITGALLALASVVIIPTIMAYVPLGELASATINTLRWTVAISSVTIAIGALYKFGPSRRRRMPLITLGTIVAALLWITVSTAFSVYLSNFSNYDEVYGPLGAVVVLLIWFYLSAFVVLLGAELNAEIEEHAIHVAHTKFPHLLAENDPLMQEMTGTRDP